MATITNTGFDTGADEWALSTTGASTIGWSSTGGKTTAGCILFNSQNGQEGSDGGLSPTGTFFVTKSQSVTASIYGKITSGTTGSSFGISLAWYGVNNNFIGRTSGNSVSKANATDYAASSVTGTAPEGAVTCVPFISFNGSRKLPATIIYADDFSWTYEEKVLAELEYPLDGSEYDEGVSIPFRLTNKSGLVPVSVRYVATNNSTTVETEVGTSTESPFSINYDALPDATYTVVAYVKYSDSLTITTNSAEVTVGNVEPVTREYNASNSYTYLVADNFSNLSSGLPPTARVTGVDVVMNYGITALIRSKDKDVTDVETSRYQAAFDMFPTGNFGIALLTRTDDGYTVAGAEQTESVDLNSSDFTLVEDAISDGKRYTSLSSTDASITIGGDEELFGLSTIPASDFTDYAIGIRFYPTLGTKPDYADSGDAVFRLGIDKIRLRVYFDAGSVEYYFVSPDGNDIIKGRLAAYCVDSGDWESGDATGDLQLAPDLEVIQGNSTNIGQDWAIHAQQSPTDQNKIGVVAESMTYNGLPGQAAIVENRSRYQMISANFYGDPTLDSIYGVHGLPRAFSYNGEFFYKICTQPDPAKDSPRHVAFHQTHLALGYKEGRVDISVVGEPYNFDGALGASSWATGDRVTGLLPLTGAILAVYGSKSIVGINGTTVDNFATQTLNPKLGATEYTVMDMGFPVHANSNGIYTLEQTASYGQYLGTPLSAPVSPWLRPRLIRSTNSAKEVVCAWPVRSKNQYRLAFADGYVLSQTMNNGQQSAPTYSFQKYFWTVPDSDPVLEGIDMKNYPAIYPIAVSSEMDETGEERIHVAHLQKAPDYYGSEG